MNTGEKALDWIYRDMLQVDEQWSVQTLRGFSWWADKNAQTVEITGTETNEDGDTAYIISVETDFLRNVQPSGKVLTALNTLVMSIASMAGPVYDERAGTVKLCSVVKVHEGIRSWMSPLIGMASVLQIAEARVTMHQLAKFLGAEPAETGHPQNGVRVVPDDMAKIVSTLIAPAGTQPCSWPQAEFDGVVQQFMQKPPAVLVTGGRLGFTVEFPFGELTSLCQANGDAPHPRLGNGLLVLQSFPVKMDSEADGAGLALSLNALELTRKPFGYGFGSYCYRDQCIHFTTFWPNKCYRQGLLPNIYFAAGQRAREMSLRLAKSDWTSTSSQHSLRQKESYVKQLCKNLRLTSWI